jgi:hypothetical protein
MKGGGLNWKHGVAHWEIHGVSAGDQLAHMEMWWLIRRGGDTGCGGSLGDVVFLQEIRWLLVNSI